MPNHPLNKYQRKTLETKKHKFVNEKKGILEAERPEKIRRKLTIEQIKQQEAEQELRNASYRKDN